MYVRLGYNKVNVNYVYKMISFLTANMVFQEGTREAFQIVMLNFVQQNAW